MTYSFPAAPWPTCLKTTSWIATAVLAGVSYAVFKAIPRGTRVPFAETFGTLVAFVQPLIALPEAFLQHLLTLFAGIRTGEVGGAA